MRGGLFARAAAAGGVRGRVDVGGMTLAQGAAAVAAALDARLVGYALTVARGGAGVRVPPAAGVLEGRRRRRPPAGAGRGRYTARRAALPRGRRRGARGHLRGGVPPPRGRIRRLLPVRARALSLHGRGGRGSISTAPPCGRRWRTPSRAARARRRRLFCPFRPAAPSRKSKRGRRCSLPLRHTTRMGGSRAPQHRAGGVAAERLRAGGGRGALLQRARGRAHRAKRLPRSARHRARRVCRGGGRRRVPRSAPPFTTPPCSRGFPSPRSTRTASPSAMCPPRATRWSAAATAI